MAEKLMQPSTHPNSIPFYNYSGGASQIPLPANKDSWLAVVNAISMENEHFRNQQRWIESQMIKLSKLSDNLIKENEQLRSLYRGRTQDISRFLTTMAINTNEITGEHEHRQFLFKELNYFILKQIKANAAISSELSQSIKEKQQKANELNQLRMKIEQQELGQLKVKLRVDFKSSQLKDIKSKQLSQIQDVDLLQGSVYQLIIHNKSLQSQISSLSNQKQTDYAHIQFEKIEYKNNYEYVIIENKKYRNEIVKDKIDLERVESQVISKKQKYATVIKALGLQMRNYDKNQQIAQQVIAQRQKLKRNIQQAVNRVNSSKIRLQKARQQKQDILDKIKGVRNHMRQLSNNSNKALDQILYTQIEKISAIKAIFNKNKLQADQKLKAIKQQRSKVEEVYERVSGQAGSLMQKNQMYKNLIATIGNPVKQMEKIQLMARLRSFR